MAASPAQFENVPAGFEEALAELRDVVDSIETNTSCDTEDIAALLVAVSVSLLAAHHAPAEIHSWMIALVDEITGDLANSRKEVQ